MYVYMRCLPLDSHAASASVMVPICRLFLVSYDYLLYNQSVILGPDYWLQWSEECRDRAKWTRSLPWLIWMVTNFLLQLSLDTGRVFQKFLVEGSSGRHMRILRIYGGSNILWLIDLVRIQNSYQWYGNRLQSSRKELLLQENRTNKLQGWSSIRVILHASLWHDKLIYRGHKSYMPRSRSCSLSIRTECIVTCLRPST